VSVAEELVDEFTREFTRTIARIGAVIVAVLLIHYLLSSVVKLERSDVTSIIREVVVSTVSRLA
jgi:hypothetical protein